MFDNFILQNTKTGNQVEFNFEEGETPTPSSDVSNSTVAFTEAQTRTNIATGEKLSVICGKIKKFFADLKTVAFTGSYNDLINKPDLFSGNYNDLTNKPDLFSGDYNDLTNKPTIPTVNNGTLTIRENGVTKGTFTANQFGDTEIDLTGGGSEQEIVELTQAQYDALEQSGQLDPDIAYFINDATGGTLGTAAYKDYTDRVRPNNFGLVESHAVYSAINSALSSIYTPRGNIDCANLTASMLTAANVGNVYETNDAGTTSALFIQGAGHTINTGDNVGIIRAGAETILFNLMGNAFDLTAYQKQELTNTTQGATTVEGALTNLASQKVEQSDINSAVATVTPHLATVEFTNVTVTGNGGLTNLDVGANIPSDRTIIGYRGIDVWQYAGNVIPVPIGTLVRLVNTYSQDVTIGTIRVEYLYI